MNSNIFRECKIIYLSQKPSFLGQHENRHPETSNVLQNLNYRFLSKKCLNEKLLSKKRRFLALEEGTCIQKASENPFVEVEGWEQLFKENSLDRTLLKA